MTEIERIDRAADYIRGVAGEADIAVVLGSGLGDYVEALTDARMIPYSEIPGFPMSTVAGHAGELWAGMLHGKRVLMMRGRFHSYEGHPLNDVVLPIRAMARMGVQDVILTNAAGAVNVDFAPGDLMLITDFINFSGKNPLTGPNVDGLGPRFPDMSRAYDKRLRAIAAEAALERGITLREGVYAFFTGPCYETAAEIRAYHILGADAIGMSTVPETTVANYLGMRVLGIACITNMATGIARTPHSHEEVLAIANASSKRFCRLLEQVLSEMPVKGGEPA